MDRITRKFGGIERVVTIYTKEEAEGEGLSFVPWREAKTGAWGLTDDAYVAEVVRVGEYRRRGKVRRHVVLSFASRWDSPGALFLFTPHRDKGRFGGTAPRAWIQVEVGKTRLKTAVKTYVQMLVSGEGIDWKTLGKVYRSDQKRPEQTIRKLLKQEVVKQMVDAELEGVLKAKGVTKEYVLDLYKEAVDIARANGEGEAIRKVANDLADLIDMKPKMMKQVRQLTMTTNRELEGAIAREERELLYSETATASPLDVQGLSVCSPPDTPLEDAVAPTLEDGRTTGNEGTV